MSLDAMRELTDFTLQPTSPGTAMATVTEAGQRVGVRQAFGVEKPVQPLFRAMDASRDEVLVSYPMLPPPWRCVGTPRVCRSSSARRA